MDSAMDLKKFREMCSDARKFNEAYFIQSSSFFKDVLAGSFSYYVKSLSSGDVKGDSLIGLCFGPFLFFTLPLCDYFNEITFACPDDKSTQETQKWLTNEPDAMDWSDAVRMVCEIQGCGETWIEKQEILKIKVKRVLKYDASSCEPFSPVIHPRADCLLLACALEGLVTDKKSYCDALKNVSSLLKPGGHLIMIVALETTFYMCGDFKFPLLCIDADFLKDAVTGAGYEIEEDHIYRREFESLYDVTDYKYFAFIKACKQKDRQ
ncbi:indolethylamine N-methyltransferase-like [Lissotriton helveticus]